MIKQYLKFIVITGLLAPALYFFFKAEGKDPLVHCLAIFLPAWLLGILLLNYLQNGHGLDFRDKSEE
jgi:hypothetical protein